MAFRPQNRCKTYGYTWHPRGKDVSLRCPNCGGRNVEVPGLDLTGCLGGCLIVGAVLAVLGCGVGVLVPLLSPSKKAPPVADNKPAPEKPPVPPPAPVTPLPPPPVKVGDVLSLTNSTGFVPVAASAAVYAEYRKANESARIDLYRADKVFMVPIPQKATVEAVDGELLKVKIADGPHKGRVGWCDAKDAIKG